MLVRIAVFSVFLTAWLLFSQGTEKFLIKYRKLLGLDWFCRYVLCDGPTKLASSRQPIRCKTKTDRHEVIRVFPRLRSLAFSHWFIVMLSSVLIGCSVYLAFSHTTFSEKSCSWGSMNNYFVGERHLWRSLRRIKASRRLNCEQFWQNGQVTERWSRQWFVQTSLEFRSLFLNRT